MGKEVVKQLNTNVSEELIGRIEKYVYENKNKEKTNKTLFVTQAIEKLLKSKGY